MIKQNNKRFDLEERTSVFGERIINFCQKTRITLIVEPLIKQLIRSATSIGANYMEANGSDSKKDFKNKISICKKEAKETTYWLRMLANSLPDKKEELRIYWTEARELSLIFAAIINKLR
jgi:four helix bundle protein